MADLRYKGRTLSQELAALVKNQPEKAVRQGIQAPTRVIRGATARRSGRAAASVRPTLIKRGNKLRLRLGTLVEYWGTAFWGYRPARSLRGGAREWERSRQTSQGRAAYDRAKTVWMRETVKALKRAGFGRR